MNDTNANAEIERLRSQVAALEQSRDAHERTALEQARRLEQALEEFREREKDSRLIIETAYDAFISIDANGIITEWNRQAEITFGWSRAEIMGRPLAETIIPPQYREAYLRGLQQFLLTGGGPVLNKRFELTALHRDRREFPVELTMWPLRSGNSVRFNAFVHDITERQRAEHTLQQANERLQRSIDKLEEHAREVSLLSELTDLLQSCRTAQEAYTVVAQSAQKIFAGESGALHVFSPSRNLLEEVAMWGEALQREKTFRADDCWALRRGRAHRVEAPLSGLLCPHLSQVPEFDHLCVPMIAQGQGLGLLSLHSSHGTRDTRTAGQEDITEAKQRLAVAVTEHIGLALANLHLRESLRLQSIRDPLTGLFNRRYMEESLEHELSRAARNQYPLGIIMLDLDHFKLFNDTFGHEAGDMVLRIVANCLQTRIRREDTACRFGGEEFLLILPAASVDMTRQRAEILREEVKGLTPQSQGQVLGAITISCGVSAFPEHGSSVDEILRAADSALYRAKAEGRDRVIVG